MAVNLIRALFACVVVLSSLLSTSVRGTQPPSEVCNSRLRRAHASQVADNFRFWQERRFFGQHLAVDATIQALRKFKSADFTVLHYVGASGTGKTYLAYIVQRSFFAIKQCRRVENHPMMWARNDVGKYLDQVMPCPLSEYEPFELVQFYNACGVAYADLLNYLSEADAIRALASALDTAVTTRTGDDPAIAFVDNFNKCKGECERFMSDAVTRRSYYSTRLNRKIDLTNTILLVTSDLSEEGLKLAPDDTREEALKRIHTSTVRAWGQSSLWNDRAYQAPFVPYTEQELVKITEMTLEDIKEEIRENIDHELLWEKKRLELGFGSTVEWVGRFKIAEQDKVRLLDKVHHEVSIQNARAFEKVRGWLIAASRRPVAIELQLARRRPVEEEPNMPAAVRGVMGMVLSSPIKKLKYTQNIVFKVVEDKERPIVVEIEEADWQPGFRRSDEL